MTLEQDQIIELKARISEFKRTGFPEKAAVIKLAMDNGEMPPPEYLANEGELVTNEGVIEEIPPRAGKGSGIKVWKKFVREHTDWEDDVIDALGTRDEVIATLEANGIIPRAE